ncbi:MAG: HigA family addiction module antidote protein [Gammaproteobacteria bacterium]|nr:HigA family addiction module antidote protein [Gammaproteobacteria bacterium]
MSRPANAMRPIHPGEILREEFMVPLELSANALAISLGVPATRIHEIVNGRRGITADTATRLARHFGGDAASWLALQNAYDLKTLPNLSEIERTVQPRAA